MTLLQTGNIQLYKGLLVNELYSLALSVLRTSSSVPNAAEAASAFPSSTSAKSSAAANMLSKPLRRLLQVTEDGNHGNRFAKCGSVFVCGSLRCMNETVTLLNMHVVTFLNIHVVTLLNRHVVTLLNIHVIHSLFL